MAEKKDSSDETEGESAEEIRRRLQERVQRIQSQRVRDDKEEEEFRRRLRQLRS